MAYPIEKKLVVAVASSALFDLTNSDHVFTKRGEEAYRKYQREHLDDMLEKGVAFPFVRRLLGLNSSFPEEKPVEVVLLSRNDPETGLRVMRSIKKYGLDITRAAFLTGKSPHPYIPAFNTSIFLSANANDVRQAVHAGYPAGTVLKTEAADDAEEKELRIAFDFDGVIVDDAAEAIYQRAGDVEEFQQAEIKDALIPHRPGPLQSLFQKISFFQKMEIKRQKKDPAYQRILRTAIVTSRNAPSHERVVTTLHEWGVFSDETFFLGGIEKRRVLEILKPHIYFDDQLTHLKTAAKGIPSVHIPFGVANKIASPKQ